ncbi:MAG: hypothetical protein IPI04_04465 [Ignavibacteria bacterium]|nr:hypothetical protein [Ignavibacteria bacterium]
MTPDLGEYITLISEGFYSVTFPPSGWSFESPAFDYLTKFRPAVMVQEPAH